MKHKSFLFIFCLLISVQASFPQLIIDHLCTDINGVPQAAIIAAKDSLHIAYGHTSHGSQVIDGMNGLISFANSGGRGLSLPVNIFAWNNGGEDGALDLHNNAMDGDVGYYPDWYNETVSYLNNGANPDVNVIMWSWCGQVGTKYSDGVLWDEYLGPMNSLETDYPGKVFIYMTGHLDYWNRENTNAANDSIRSYCRNNHKVLFDFADIESYSPNGNCYKDIGDDACDYYNTDDDSVGNWAVEYQNSHTEGVDWYYCGSQHSEPLNANRKAYAAWWMFASLAGWNYVAPPVEEESNSMSQTLRVFPNPSNNILLIETEVSPSPMSGINIYSASGQLVRRMEYDSYSHTGSSISIPVDNLSAGIYLLQLSTNAGIHSIQFAVLH
jgi:hypothetical protein